MALWTYWECRTVFSFSVSVLRCPTFPVEGLPLPHPADSLALGDWQLHPPRHSRVGVWLTEHTMHSVPVMSLRIHLLHKLQSSILLSLLFFLSVILDPCIPLNAALCGLLIACPPSLGLNETLLPPPAWVELIRIFSEEAFLKSSTEAPDISDVSKGFRARQMALQYLLWKFVPHPVLTPLLPLGYNTALSWRLKKELPINILLQTSLLWPRSLC